MGGHVIFGVVRSLVWGFERARVHNGTSLEHGSYFWPAALPDAADNSWSSQRARNAGSPGINPAPKRTKNRFKT